MYLSKSVKRTRYFSNIVNNIVRKEGPSNFSTSLSAQVLLSEKRRAYALKGPNLYEA